MFLKARQDFEFAFVCLRTGYISRDWSFVSGKLYYFSIVGHELSQT